MKPLRPLSVVVVCGLLNGCAHSDKKTETYTIFPGAFKSGGITYYPTYPGTTNYSVVDYTTNPPPAGVQPSVTVVTTNARWRINLVDDKGHAFTNIVAQ